MKRLKEEEDIKRMILIVVKSEIYMFQSTPFGWNLKKSN